MADTEHYWKRWSPYWVFLEDFFLDLEIINKLTIHIENPVLIIGAGQGLLVEELQKKGFQVDGVDLEPSMITYAQKRRGLNLIQANGKNMPFSDRSYKTSVTDNSGKVFVAFYQYHPKVEKLFRYSGLITDKGVHLFRRMGEMTKLSCDNPIGYIKAFKSEANVGYCSAL
ncbi:MAG: class I SAM-dependent methyltransferase, partial [Planctomycetota bacterium]